MAMFWKRHFQKEEEVLYGITIICFLSYYQLKVNVTALIKNYPTI